MKIEVIPFCPKACESGGSFSSLIGTMLLVDSIGRDISKRDSVLDPMLESTSSGQLGWELCGGCGTMVQRLSLMNELFRMVFS